MAYPSANPAAKHDLLCPASVVDAVRRDAGGDSHDDGAAGTMESLASSIVRSAVPLTRLPPDVSRLSTVYTYPDAPKRPKPLSRAPRVWGLVRRDLFDRATNDAASADGGGDNLLKRCAVAVKLPSRIPPGDSKSCANSKSFRDLVRFLRARGRVAALACDSAGRIAFLVPSAPAAGGGGDDWDGDGGGEGEESDHAADLFYAPMKEFLRWAKDNHAASSAHPPSRAGDGDEPATWTPQYAPPPEEECGPRGWDAADGDEPATWTPQYAPPPEEECGPRGWDGPDAGIAAGGDDGAAGLFVPPGSSSPAPGDDAAGLFVPPGGSDDAPGEGGEDAGAGLWGWDNGADAGKSAPDADGGGGGG